MPEEKQSQLEILCEVPLKVKIGDQNFIIRPLTFNRVIQCKSSIINILNEISNFDQLGELIIKHATEMMSQETGKDSEDGESTQTIMEGFLEQLFDNLQKVMDDVCTLMKVLLTASGDFEVTDDFLKEHLDTLTLGKILGFLVKTSNIGETVKNVSILRGMAK